MDSLKSFFGGGFCARKISEDTVVFYSNGYDFLLRKERWQKVKYSFGESPSLIPSGKKLYSATGNVLFIERGFSPPRIENGLPIKLCDVSEKQFGHAKIEKPIGFKLKGKGKQGFLYHLYSEGIALDKIKKKTPQEMRKKLVESLANSTRTVHSNSVLYYGPLSLPWFEEELIGDIRYDRESKIVYSPHQLIRFEKLTSNDRTRELACLLYHFDWINSKDTIEFLVSYYGKETSIDGLNRRIENIRKEAVEIYGLGLREHGIFHLREEEKKMLQVKRDRVRSRENRIMREIRDNQKKKMLEDYLGK